MVVAAVAAAATVAATAESASSSASSSKYSAKVASQNANLANTEANASIDQGYLNAQKDYQEGAQRLGAQRAQMAANGVDISSGSSLETQQATARNTGNDVGTDLYNADAKAVSYRNQTASYYNEEKANNAAATNAKVKGGFDSLAAGSSFASKWDDMFSSGSSKSDFSGTGTAANSSFKA